MTSARERRLHHGMVKLALGFIDLRLGLQVLRMLRRLDIGIAAKPGQLRCRLLLQRLKFALVVEQRVVRLIEHGL